MIPLVCSSLLHVGLAWGALGVSLAWVPRPLSVFPVYLAPVLPEPPPPLPRPERPRPSIPRPAALPKLVRHVTPPTPIPEPARSFESTANATPPALTIEETRVEVGEDKNSTPPEPAASVPEKPGPAEASIAITGPPPAVENGPIAPAGDSRPPKASSAGESPRAPSAPRIASVPPAGSGSAKTVRPGGGYQVVPTYPANARRLGIEGTTLLRVLVLDDGRVGEIQIQQSAGHPDLDRAAAEAVRRWRFDPARKGADAVAVWVLLPVEFHLTR